MSCWCGFGGELRACGRQGTRTGRYLTFSCSVLMMSVRFLPSTCSWKTHMCTSSSNWSVPSTLRPTILAIAEPQLPEPMMATFSFCEAVEQWTVVNKASMAHTCSRWEG